MPLSEYKCTACNAEFEQRHAMKFTGTVSCPKCSEPARKVISSPAIVMNWRDSDSVHESKRFRPAASTGAAQKEA